MSTVCDSGVTFSSQMSTSKTTSIISDIGLNISQLRILLRIVRNKLGAIFGNLEVNLNLFYFGFVILMLFIRKRI